MKKTTLLLTLFAAFATSAHAQRIVVLTPDTADIVAELGAANQVVAIHDHNHHPAYQNKPTIGFYRTLSPEPIVAQRPDLVIGSYMALPPNTYTRLQQAGLKAENVNPQETVANYIAGIRRVGQLLNKPQAANQLAARFETGMRQLPATGRRYLLSYDGRHVAGRGTVGDTLIRLAGGINAAAGVEGLKPLSREAWLAAKPDVVIIAKHNESIVGGTQGISSRPELASSNAVRNGKVLFWNADDFLRFGLHSPQSVKRLNDLAR